MGTGLHPSDFVSLTEEKLRRAQSDRLVTLVDRLRVVGNPYWRGKLGDAGAVGSLDDLDQLPMTTKAEFRESYPFGMLAVPLEDVVRVHASSGTSGKPTIGAYTASDVGMFAEVNARSLALAGADSSSVVHVAYGYGLFTGGLGLHFGVEALGATAIPASGGNSGFQVRMLGDLGATGLACTPSYSLLLAERAAEEGLLDAISLRWGIHGAEPWSEGMRHKIEEAWGGGFDACDIYGLSEIIGPGVASEWVAHRGRLVIAEDHFYPEIIDPATGKGLADGEVGELVLTTLTKEAQPVIRYRTGDITRLLPPVGGLPFRCMDRLWGRVDDMLIVRGINVYPREIETVLLSDPDLGGQFLIYVDKRGVLTEIEAKVELRSPDLLSRRDVVAERLQRRLLETLRLRVKVAVADPGELPRQEIGKAKRVHILE
ncbi:MAG: phenylacetate--CoA ligase [bacterium]|nr:phenylacetate--CoA ligase [Acidimicrobiia bacterium]MCY4651287.1 phenylacetate--CoA ligase [bacterium]